MRTFNTTGPCTPSKHYMVDPSEKVGQIKAMVDRGKYFTINRARQYGKTTTINWLSRCLGQDYDVLKLNFQRISSASFETEEGFIQAFCRQVLARGRALSIPDNVKSQLRDYASRERNKVVFDELFSTLSDWCGESEKPIVMVIDEVDAATNNQVFLDFLAQLRTDYLERTDDPTYGTFRSVILVGVTDVKHLKAKIRPEEEGRQNSPWNIATDFLVDMSLSEEGIKGMLDEYEADHHTGMDTVAVARSVHEWTNGYPFLVSRICQLVDESVSKEMPPDRSWTSRGINEAVKLILSERNTLFDSLTKNLNDYPKLKASIRTVLMEGAILPWNPDLEDIARMQMYGLIENFENTVRIDNRVFETRLYNLFLSDERLRNSAFAREGGLARNMFVRDGRLDVRLVLERFVVTYTQVKGPLKEPFKERDGREDFLLFLKPIINVTGNYYIEAQTRDEKRTDVIVDCLGQQYVIELKIWHGERHDAEGERQISAYLDYWNLDVGYMLSFNFDKRKKEQGVRRVQVADKVLFEAMV